MNTSVARHLEPCPVNHQAHRSHATDLGHCNIFQRNLQVIAYELQNNGDRRLAKYHHHQNRKSRWSPRPIFFGKLTKVSKQRKVHGIVCAPF